MAVQYATNLHSLQAHAQSRALDQAKRKLARHLSPPVPGLQNRQPTLTRRWGKVAGLNSDGTVNLTLDGTNVGPVSVLNSYSPAVGDPVILDILGSDPVVIGSAGKGTRPNSGVPSGALLDYAGGTVPVGYLLCDGSAVSRTTYAALFAAIGTSWGAGDGSTTFNLPDLRGRAAIGSGTGSGLSARTLATKGGEENHTLAAAEMPVHNHPDSGHNHGNTGGVSANHYHTIGGSGNTAFRYSSSAEGTASAYVSGVTFGNLGNETSGHVHGTGTVSANSANAGSGGGHNTMMPYAVVTKIIKT